MSEETITKYKPLYSMTEILENIKRVLTESNDIDNNCNCIPITLDDSCISIYDVYNTIFNKMKEFKKIEEHYSNVLDNTIKERFGDKCSCIFYGLNFENLEISIGFQKGDYNYKKICFAKYNDDLYLKSSETALYIDEIFALIGNTISNAYDELIKFKDFEQEYKYWRNSVNSNFKINISNHGIEIIEKQYGTEFSLRHYHWEKGYKCKCNSINVLNTIKGHEDEIFKRIFIEIENCPNWMKKQLYEIRKHQINNSLKEKQRAIAIKKNKIEENSTEQVVENKQKKSGFKRKILSLFKK